MSESFQKHDQFVRQEEALRQVVKILNETLFQPSVAMTAHACADQLDKLLIRAQASRKRFEIIRGTALQARLEKRRQENVSRS